MKPILLIRRFLQIDLHGRTDFCETHGRTRVWIQKFLQLLLTIAINFKFRRKAKMSTMAKFRAFS